MVLRRAFLCVAGVHALLAPRAPKTQITTKATIAPAERTAVGGAARTLSTRASGLRMGLGDFSANTIDGKDTKLSAFVGKPTLVVNVASL